MGLLVDDEDFVLTVMTDAVDDSLLEDVIEDPAPGNPSTFHVGFYVESRETVEEYREEMIDGGHDVTDVDELFGQYFFYTKVPGGDGLAAEVSTRPKQLTER